MIEPVNSRCTSLCSVGVERREIDRDDRTARAGQPGDQAVADLAAGAGHERYGCAHEGTILGYGLQAVGSSSRLLPTAY